MNAHGFSIAMLQQMAHSTLANYVVPGLKSSLIGAPSHKGTVRLFESDREHQEAVTPHSHRFDFQCWVLAGTVRNRIWSKCLAASTGDLFEQSVLDYGGSPGEYQVLPGPRHTYSYAERRYDEGECYSMGHSEIHSIYFSRGAKVLFFEGPQRTERSVILQPVVDGEVVTTFKTEAWMFRRAESGKSGGDA